MTSGRDLFWRVQRPVVDTGRGLVARLQSPPAPRRPVSGPLLDPGHRRPLEHLDRTPLVQPDRTSCGSATLTVLRMLRDPAYAASVLDAADPQRAFGTAALGVRRRTNTWRDARGSLQLPWPAALGTRPAAMVRLLDAPEGYGAPGRRHRTLVLDPADPGPVLDAVAATVAAGEPVPVFIGDGHWMQHIVLAVAATDDALGVYEPACGRVLRVPRQDLLAGTLSLAGWRRAWLAVLPR